MLRPASDFRRHSSGSRSFAVSFAASLRLVLVLEHVAQLGSARPTAKGRHTKAVLAPQDCATFLKTSLSGDLVETDGTG